MSRRWERRCNLGQVHYHFPAWKTMGERGDVPGRMMLLVWWPSQQARKYRRA